MQLVDEGLISPRFHAIVDLRCGEVIGYEGLTRPAPGSGFERPDLLFDAALATGTQFELESLALEMLLTQANAWAEAPLLFVNTTPAFLADDRAVPFILDLIDSLDRVGPARIVLEVTERSDLSYDNILSERVEQLTGRGFQIAIDDVGAGANGLNRIMRLKPGWLKLDRELVAGIDADPVRENLIRFMIRFARLTGVRLIAEGIETDPELKRLCALGAQFGQGFIFGKPEPAPRPDLNAIENLRRHLVRGTARSESKHSEIDEIIRPALIIPSGATASAAASELLQNAEARGALIVDNGEAIRWIARDELLRAAATPASRTRPADSIGKPIAVRLDTSSSFIELLEATASRADTPDAAPAIVMNGPGIRGIVLLQDVLRHAAARCGSIQFRVSPLTGLPGRVECEQFLGSLIESATPDLSATFIDLRKLASFNRTYGFESGDDLIRDLASSITATIDGSDDDCRFFGHFGNDCFLVIGSEQLSSTLGAGVPTRFAEISERVGGFKLNGSGVELSAVGVRVLVLPDAFRNHASLDEIFRAEQTLRKIADEQASKQPGSVGSVVVEAHDDDDARFGRAA